MTSNQPEAPMTHDSDMDLVTRTLQGDSVAFGTLVERYQRAVYAVCVSILHDFDLARDLTQEAFLKALQHLPRLAIPARFGNWLRIIAMNECRLYIRRRQATMRPERPFYEQVSWGQAHRMSVEQQQELHQQQDEYDRLGVAALRSLERLSDTHRQALTLHYLSGYSLKEVGAFLGISPAAVKMRLHRARQQIQREAIAMVEYALTQQQLGPEFAQRLQLADITVLFADIAGIMDIFAQYSSEEALTLLYECMGDMTQCIVDTGGTLQGYYGDEIVAFWGAPVPSADHAVQGCLAALAIQAKVAALDAQHHQPGKPHLHVKCGLQTGKLFVGELTPRRPPAYSFLGMVAAMASTLKSATHRFGTAILAARETYEQAQETIEARLVGQLKTRFHHEPIMAYEVLARKGALESPKMQASARYLEGLAHYQARRWEQALPAFIEALHLDPSDGPSRFYQERCEALLAAPPEVIVL
jgi:RNA polymerase sigma factor (sigma-70 family)